MLTIVLAAVLGELLLAVGIGKLIAAGARPTAPTALRDATVVPFVRRAG